jgi:hypothetical protein
MIQFTYSGNPSLEELQTAKQSFIEKLGDFKNEFEEKNGTVHINFNLPLEDEKRFTFNLGEIYELHDFIARWNQYNRERFQ